MPDPRLQSSPRTVNQILADRAIRHSVYMIRLAGGEVNELKALLPKLRRAVVQAITPLLADLDPDVPLRAGNEMLIEEVTHRASREVSTFLQEYENEMHTRTGKMALSEAEFEQRLLTRTIPIQTNFALPSDQLLRSILDTEPLSGRTMRDWFSELTTQTRLQVGEQIREGMLEGESIDKMLRRVRGTREAGFRDGIIGRTGGHAQSIVRSAVMRVSNHARALTHQANSEVIKGYQVLLTLDSRTCEECVSIEAQNPFPPTEYPGPPFHIGCRCVVVAVIKSWQELGIDLDEAPPGTRASMDGQVAETMDYPQWFARQSKETQLDILGPSRFELFEKGAPVTSFAERGQIYTLDELRAREADLF